jgi:hypothetical protein
VELLSPHRKAVSPGQVVGCSAESLVYVSSPLNNGSSGAPLLLLKHLSEDSFDGIVYGSKLEFNANAVLSTASELFRKSWKIIEEILNVKK